MCGRGRDTKRDRSQIQCPNCIKYGHCERECWFKRKNVGDLHTKVSKRNCDTTETLLLTSHMTQEGPKNNWFLDIGCKLVARVDKKNYLLSYTSHFIHGWNLEIILKFQAQEGTQ